MSKQLKLLCVYSNFLSKTFVAKAEYEILQRVLNLILSSILEFADRRQCENLKVSISAFNSLVEAAEVHLTKVIQNESRALVKLLDRLFIAEKHFKLDGLTSSIEWTSVEGFELNSPLSDPHGGGHIARKIDIEQYSWIYKPRSVCSEILLQSLLNSLGDASGLAPPIPGPKIITRGTYGWMQWLDYAPVDSPAELESYYFRAGHLCALATLLGATDLHYENIIVNGCYPHVVDAEGLLQPTPHGIKQSLKFMLLRTGLIGLFGQKLGRSDDWSGITFTRRPLVGSSPGIVADSNSVEIFVRRHSVSPYKNYPPRRHTNNRSLAIQHFISGFLATRRNLLRSRKKVAQIILEHLDIDQYSTRVFLRPTRRYVQMHRAMILGRVDPALTRGEFPIGVLEAEKSQLSEGDVPKFLTPLRSQAVTDDTECIVAQNYFSQSPFMAQYSRLQEDCDFWLATDRDIEDLLLVACNLPSRPEG